MRYDAGRAWSGWLVAPDGELHQRSWRGALEEPLEVGVSHVGSCSVAPLGELRQASELRRRSCRSWRVALEELG